MKEFNHLLVASLITGAIALIASKLLNTSVIQSTFFIFIGMSHSIITESIKERNK